MSEYRTATVADVMRYMQAEPRFERHSVSHMGYGMGDAQNGVEAAVFEAERLGLVTAGKDPINGVVLMASLAEAGKVWAPPREPQVGDDAYVTLTDGTVEKWDVTNVYGAANEEAEACQTTEEDGYQVGVFGRGVDATWHMHARGTVTFQPAAIPDEPSPRGEISDRRADLTDDERNEENRRSDEAGEAYGTGFEPRSQ